MINRVAVKYGIPDIAAGDNEQNKVVGEYAVKKDSKGNVEVYELAEISRDNFYTIPKIGVSVRAENQAVVDNLLSIRNKLVESLKTNTISSTGINLSYNQTDSTFFGYKKYQYDDTINKNFQKDVDFIFDHTDKKVGIIIDDLNSDLLKYLQSQERYKDKFEYYIKGDAQSQEADYYIIEDLASDEANKVKPYQARMRSLYTAFSRVSKGALILSSDNTMGSYLDANSSEILLSDIDKADAVREFTETIDKVSKEK